jgi:ribosomal protein L29
MKSKELKSKSKEELETQLLEMRKELIKLNTQVATGTTLKSPGQVKKIKKNIARLMTQLNAK